MVNHSCPFEDCNSTFSRPYRLRIHIQRHQGIKEFQCVQCNRSYHRRQHLQRHVAEAHQNQSRLEQPLSCGHCERQFNTAWGLRRHQVKIKEQKTRVRKHCCGICSRRFYSADDLERHSFVHERFTCIIPSCPLLAHKFNWSFYNQHMADYHSEPFECEHCGERFLVKSQIRRHVRLHLPEIPCTVPGCNRTFAFTRNMVNHIQVGHGKRVFKCTVNGCDWEFKYKSCFNRHIKIHQQNGRIIPMVNRIKKTKTKFIMATKLAGLSLKN